MPALSSYSDISSFVNTVWADSILVARENSIMAPLVQVYNDQQGMAARKNAKYGTATINQINDTDDLTSQAFTPTADQTLTPYEYGAQFFVTDMRFESDIYNVGNDAAQELGIAFGQKVDTSLVGLFSSFTGGTVGGSGTVMSWSTFYGAITKARNAFMPAPWTMVISPNMWYSMGTALAPGVTVTNSPAMQDELLNRFFVGRVSGVDIYTDANIATGSGKYGGLFSRSAIALDWRRAPRIRPERDESRRGLELNFSSVFAYGVWRPQYGIAICADSLAPA